MYKNDSNEKISANKDNDLIHLENKKMFPSINSSGRSTLSRSNTNYQNDIITNSNKNESLSKSQNFNDNKNNFFLKIDSKNVFKQFTKFEEEIISEKIKGYKNTFSSKKIECTANILNRYFKEKIKFGWSVFNNSLYISKYICNSNKTKDYIESYINYFFSLRYEITYASTFILNGEGIKNLGQILCYIFSRLNSKIKDTKTLKEYISNSLHEKKNPLIDYYNYCTENGKDTSSYKKTTFWDKNKNNYILPAELIFLVNLFSQINIIEIDINFEDENFNEDDFKLYFILMQNLGIVFLNIKYCKMNFLHKAFQEKIYLPYYKNLLKYFVSSNDLIKTNCISDNTNIYAKKWDFTTNFLLKEFRIIDFLENQNQKEIQDKEYDDFTVIGVEKPKLLKTSLKKTKIDDINPKTFFDKINDDDEYDTLDDISSRDINLTSDEIVIIDKNVCQSFYQVQEEENDIKKSKKNKNDRIYRDVIEKNKRTFDIIITTLCSFNCTKMVDKMDLILNDSYTRDLKVFFKTLYKIDIETIDQDFHILDFIIFKSKTLELMNIEFNSLDIKTFDKILNLLYLNKKLKTVNLSFFSSDITYYPHMILKTFYTLTKKAKILGNSIEYESSILDEILPYYIVNLLVTFYIIKSNLKIENLGINFDIPDIIIKEGKYMTAIKKFILNILLLLNEENNSLINFTILSPNTIMDGRIYNTIDNIFKIIKINEKKSILTKLNIQFQFYKIPHITNIISSNFIYLNIGDLDLYTFSCLINYLSSFKFAKNSLLKKLSISLMKRIDVLSPKLKVLLRQLFSIKLKNFKILNLYTNVLIDKKKEYNYIIKILNNNWISEYNITFNEKSKGFVNSNSFYKDNIKFLVPHNLESELINIDENKDHKNLWTHQDDAVFWYLQYLFTKKYFYVTKRFKDNKTHIYNILKYLYFEKKSKINHDLLIDKEI